MSVEREANQLPVMKEYLPFTPVLGSIVYDEYAYPPLIPDAGITVLRKIENVLGANTVVSLSIVAGWPVGMGTPAGGDPVGTAALGTTGPDRFDLASAA